MFLADWFLALVPCFQATMSTSETVTFEKGPCPCGKGHLAEHITTQDNPWSTANIRYEVACPDCRDAWRLEHGSWVLRSSESSYLKAQAAEETAWRPLRLLMDELVADYFARFAAPNKKVEHAEMTRLGITASSYRQYLAQRRKGSELADACFGLRNEDWLRSIAAARSLDKKLDEFLNAHLAAQETTTAASASIVRRKIA